MATNDSEAKTEGQKNEGKTTQEPVRDGTLDEARDTGDQRPVTTEAIRDGVLEQPGDGERR